MSTRKNKKTKKLDLEEYFLSPRNVGILGNASHFARAANPICDDDLALYLRVENGVIHEARFQAKACSATIGLASIATEKILGRSLDEIQKWRAADIRGWITVLPKAKMHAVELVCQVIRTLQARI